MSLAELCPTQRANANVPIWVSAVASGVFGQPSTQNLVKTWATTVLSQPLFNETSVIKLQLMD